MARWYGSTTERALNGKHVADLKRLKAALREGEPCWRCGQPMYSWQELERDHVIDRVLGGADGPAVLAHAKCNRSAGATMGNRLRGFTPAAADPGRNVICKTCGKPYHYAARGCEICGLHYHPSHGEQRTCSRACGALLVRRNRMAKGWVPKSERPKPPRRPGPVASGGREPKNGWPAVAVAYYTCRYCGKTGVTKAKAARGHGMREVCSAQPCQLARLAANNLRVRKGISAEDADRIVLAYRAEGDHRTIRSTVQQPTPDKDWAQPALDLLDDPEQLRVAARNWRTSRRW